MTFKPKLLAEVPGGTPDVQIFFHGQLLLRSEDGVTCEVAVNPVATAHVLTIEVRTKTAGSADLINMRHVGPLYFRQREGVHEGMSIEVTNPVPASPAAWKCITLDSINYESGASEPQNPPDADFRWILNLEGVNFHEKELEPPVFKSHHVIRLRNGEYFFRTAVRSNNDFVFRRTGGGKAPKDFRRIGAIASASVFLDTNQSVVLRWQDGTQEEDRTLTLTKAAGSTYEIYIENSPLYQDPTRDADLPNRDELVEYYKVIPEIPPPVPGEPPARFKFVPTHPVNPNSAAGESATEPDRTGSDAAAPSSGQRGSPSIPCQVITLDGRSN